MITVRDSMTVFCCSECDGSAGCMECHTSPSGEPQQRVHDCAPGQQAVPELRPQGHPGRGWRQHKRHEQVLHAPHCEWHRPPPDFLKVLHHSLFNTLS